MQKEEDLIEWVGPEPAAGASIEDVIRQTKSRLGIVPHEARVRFRHRRGRVRELSVDDLDTSRITRPKLQRELCSALERAGIWDTVGDCECGKPLYPSDDESGRILECRNRSCPISKTAYRAASYQLERDGHSLMRDAHSPLAAATVAELEGELERRLGAIGARSGERLSVLYFPTGHAVPQREGEMRVEDGRVSHVAAGQ